MEQPIQDAGYAAIQQPMMPIPLYQGGMNTIYGVGADAMDPTPGWMRPGNSLPNFNAFSQPQFMSPANSAQASGQLPGFAGNLGAPFTPYINYGIAYGISQMAGAAGGMDSAAIAEMMGSYSMRPWMGTGQLSGYDWFSARMSSVEMEKAMPALASINPILDAIPNLGRHPLVQRALSGDIQNALAIGVGQIGPLAGGLPSERVDAAGGLVSAIVGAYSGTKPFKLDDTLMYGSSLSETVSGIGAAANLGFFGVRGEKIDQILAAQRAGAAAENLMPGSGVAGASMASELAGDMAGEVNRFLAAGRGILGNGASAGDIFQLADSAIGIRGMSAGEATARLRDIDSLGDTLNIDGKVIASYMATMKKIYDNIGLVGSSGRIGIESALVEAEASVRSAADSGVDVSRETVIASRNSALQEEVGSFGLRRNQVVQNILNQAPIEYLRDNDLLGVKSQVNEIARELATEKDPAVRKHLRERMERIFQGLSPQMQGDVTKRSVYYDPENEALIAGMADVPSFTEGAAAGGVTAETDAAVERGLDSFFGSYSSRGEVDRIIGGRKGVGEFIERASKSGVLPALMEAYKSGNMDQYQAALEKEFGADAEAAGRAISGIVTSVQQARPVGPGGRPASAGDTVYRLTRYGDPGFEARDRVLQERDSVSVFKEIFDRATGDAFRGDKGIAGIIKDTALKLIEDPEVRSAEGFMDTLKEAAGESFEAIDKVLRKDGRIDFIKDVFSGKPVGAGGKSIYDLRESIQKIRKRYDDPYSEDMREEIDTEIGSFLEGLKIPEPEAEPKPDAAPESRPEDGGEPAPKSWKGRPGDGKVKTEDEGIKGVTEILTSIHGVLQTIASALVAGTQNRGAQAEEPR